VQHRRPPVALAARSRHSSRRRPRGNRATASVASRAACGSRSRRARRRRVRAAARAPSSKRSGTKERRPSQDVAAAGEGDHLRDPVTGGIRRVEPLGDEDRPRRCFADALLNACDCPLHLGVDGAASGGHAEKVGERDDALFDLGERVRVEGNNLGVGGAELINGAAGDRANRAEVLGQDEVGLECLEQLTVDRVQRAPVTDRCAHGVVDLEARQPRRIDARGRHDGQPSDFERPVALLGDGDQRLDEAERRDDLGRTREQGADAHRHLLRTGVRSQKTNPSRSTISPLSQAIGSAKTGPAETKVWNSPFSPQGSTPGGSSASSCSS
jgi:hypothetical protein